MALTIRQLASALELEYVGDGSQGIFKAAPLGTANEGSVAFLRDASSVKLLSETQASLVILPKEFAPQCPSAVLLSDSPEYHFAQALELLYPQPRAAEGVHEKAVVASSAVVDGTASIGPCAVIEEDVHIGPGATVGANTFIGRGTEIGASTQVYPNATIHHNCQIGKCCTLHSGTIIGDDGFGFAEHQQGWKKIPQIGRVVIGNYVDIGSNTTVDRGALGDTVIEDHVIIDNLVQIAHNVRIGANTAMAGCSAVAGSTIIGKNCRIAGGVRISGHLTIADDVFLTAASVVYRSIKKPGSYSSGVPLEETRFWRRNYNRIKQLDKIAKRLFEIEKNK